VDLGQRLLLDLFLLFVAAQLGGRLFARLRQPPLLGELLAGVVVGPHVLGLVGRPGPELAAALGSEPAARAALEGAYRTLAELGLVFLLFQVGLETRVEELLAVGRRAVVVAVLGVLLPFALGYATVHGAGRPPVEALFVGAALVATSTGITARALRDMGALRSPEARLILAAAVIDDVLSLLLLGAVAGLGGARRSSLLDLALLVAVGLGFVALSVVVGTGAARRYGPRLRPAGAADVADLPALVATGTCLGLSALAGLVGLSPIVGAFLAGLILAEARAQLDLERAVRPLAAFLTPFFFAIAGAQVDPAALATPGAAGLTAALTAAAVAGKLLGCAAGAAALGWRRALFVGVGMVPRGEVGLVAVSIGRSLHAVPEEVFAAVVALTVLTTLPVPPILQALHRAGAGAGAAPRALVSAPAGAGPGLGRVDGERARPAPGGQAVETADALPIGGGRGAPAGDR
jgi:Kef-type K+ transport system membrane component KefB